MQTVIVGTGANAPTGHLTVATDFPLVQTATVTTSAASNLANKTATFTVCVEINYHTNLFGIAQSLKVSAVPAPAADFGMVLSYTSSQILMVSNFKIFQVNFLNQNFQKHIKCLM